MEKKSRGKYSNEFLLDTSYLLPLVGIEVEGITEKDYNKILTKKLYYPSALIAELIGVVMKEAKKAKIEEILEEAVEGFNSITFGGKINLVSFELIKSG